MKLKVFILLLFVIAGVCNAAISWEYDSPLTVAETITDIGGGDYRYEYSFENVDTSPIWSFGVFSTFSATSNQTFTGHDWIDPISISVDDTATFYDGRNLDPDITWITGSSYEEGGWGDPFDSIQLSEFAFGFSYIASIYDASPKYYYYSTIASGSPLENGTFKMAAVGTTVPEPMTVSLFGLGALVLFKRKR